MYFVFIFPIQLKDSAETKKLLTDALAGEATVEELYYAIISMANLNMPSEYVYT